VRGALRPATVAKPFLAEEHRPDIATRYLLKNSADVDLVR
jgi:hypothetical protein